MSGKLVGRVYDEADLKHPEQSILVAMADHAHDDGTKVFPSVERIAWKTGYSVRQVHRIIASLKKMGVLVVVQVGRRGRNTEYRIDLSKAPKKMPFEKWRDQYGSGSDDNMTGKDGTETGQNDTNTVTPDVTPTVIQPSYSQPSYRGPQPAPKDFTPDPDTIHTLTTEHAFTPSQISAQVPLFVDYHTSRGNRMADWQAAFRSWMHKAREYGRLDANQPRYSSGPQYLTAEPPGYEGLLRMREEARRKGLLP